MSFRFIEDMIRDWLCTFEQREVRTRVFQLEPDSQKSVTLFDALSEIADRSRFLSSGLSGYGIGGRMPKAIASQVGMVVRGWPG